jgi:hypothetical protein
MTVIRSEQDAIGGAEPLQTLFEPLNHDLGDAIIRGKVETAEWF